MTPFALPSRLTILVCLVVALSGCTQDMDGSGAGGNTQYYDLAGTVALGRPGQWAQVCINTDCTRANNAGNYRLSLPLSQSQLVRAAVPEANGSLTWLTSLYRHTPGTTSVMLNINPTTTALLDAWSQFSRAQTLDNCLLTTSCQQALVQSFSASIQNETNERLGHWLGNAWAGPRDPFNDLYLADPDLDWLDDLHDHLHFNALPASLEVSDNQGNVIGSVSYIDLFSNGYPTPLLSADITDAFALPVPPPGGSNLITVVLKVSPGATFDAPRIIRLDASDSYTSPFGPLTFVQELVAPDGSVQRFTEGNVTTSVIRPGPYSWVVTVSDSAGNRNILGLILQVGSQDPLANPTFGASGSCPTDPNKIDANSINLCEEPLDGGDYGSCVPVLTGGTKTTYSPARCATNSQNGGALLGVCTDLDIELRVFYYLNPLRNTGESVSAQRSRLAQECNLHGSRWSNQP